MVNKNYGNVKLAMAPNPTHIFMVASAAYLMEVIKSSLFIESPWRLRPWNCSCWRKFLHWDYRSRTHLHSLWTHYLNRWDFIWVVYQQNMILLIHFKPRISQHIEETSKPSTGVPAKQTPERYPPYARAKGLVWRNNHLMQQWMNILKCCYTFMSDIFLCVSRFQMRLTEPFVLWVFIVLLPL